MAGVLTAAIAAAFSGVTPDLYYEYTTLLLPGNGTNGAQNNTFLDGSTNNFTITRNGNTTQGTFSPFSQTGWGGAFNTSTTYLTVTDTANLRFGSSNFTIEAWVYRNASGATQTIASKGASTPTGWVFQISSADKLVFTDTSTSITGTTSIAANTWTYVAVVRAGTGSNQTTLYVNGTSDGTGTSATNFNQTSNMLIGADRSSTNFANGYISNLRLSNTNRTISSTPTTALTADANTIFLSLNLNRFQYTDSTAAYTNISVTGTPSVVAFSPFNPTASWSAATYGGSGYFDGNGDYLSAPASNSFGFGTGDFTIEMWIYPTAIASSDVGLWYVDQTGGLVISLLPTTGYLEIGSRLTSYDLQSTYKPTLNAWTHVVCSRVSGTGYIFANGQQVATGSLSSKNYLTTVTGSSVTAGNFGNNPAGSAYFQGYISGLRVVKGSGVTSVTVPTSPPTAITNTSLLLNFTNAGIYDATSKNDLETVGNAQISTTQSKWGGSSMSFDGTGDYLKAPANIFIQGTEAFTVECWINLSNTSSTKGIIFGNGNNAFGFRVGQSYLGNVNGLNIVKTGVADLEYCSFTFSTSTWYHIAVCRSGTTIYFFVNGQQQTTLGSGGGNFSFSTPTSFYIGCNNDTNEQYAGYIQDLRITKGYARYTSNFTAPTAAFPTL